MTDIQAIIQEIDRLEPIPQIAHRVLSMVKDEEVSLPELATVLSQDAVMAANLLKVANSAYFGVPRKFESVNQAVVFLGAAQVRDLVLIASCGQNLQRPHDGYDLGAREAWKYALCSAAIARDVAERVDAVPGDLIFTGALLKDIGKVVLNQHVHQAQAEIQQYVETHNCSFKAAEKAIIGIDHAELGGYVAQAWQFAPRLVEIIRHHHQPMDAAQCKTEASIVYVADVLCMMIGIGVGGDGLAYRFYPEVFSYLEITESHMQAILLSVTDQLEDLEQIAKLTFNS